MRPDWPSAPVPRIGVGGPVGSGKTALVAALCHALSGQLALGVVAADAYTSADADFLRRAGVLPAERIRAVQTASGDGPRRAGAAVEDLEARVPGLDLILMESAGDDLTATFAAELVHRQIFVVDAAGGDRVLRKGAPAVAYADLLVINKTDLAPFVGADLDRMSRDAAAVRDGRPTLFTSLADDPGVPAVAAWVRGVRAELVPV